MPASDLFDPEDRTSAGRKVRYLYCPDCAHYSGGRVCRQCQRGFGQFTAPTGEFLEHSPNWPIVPDSAPIGGDPRPGAALQPVKRHPVPESPPAR